MVLLGRRHRQHNVVAAMVPGHRLRQCNVATVAGPGPGQVPGLEEDAAPGQGPLHVDVALNSSMSLLMALGFRVCDMVRHTFIDFVYWILEGTL